MASRCGSLSRSLISTASRASSSSSIRASPSVSSIPRSPLRSSNLSSRRSLFSIPRNVAALGCIQSLIPLHSAVAAARLTAHISTETRAFCELSQGTSLRPSYLMRLFDQEQQLLHRWSTSQKEFHAPPDEGCGK